MGDIGDLLYNRNAVCGWGRVTSSKCDFCLNFASIFIFDYEHTFDTFALKSLFRHKQHLSFFPSVRTVSPISTIPISDAADACSLRLVHFPSKLGVVAAVVPPSLSVLLGTVVAVIVIVSVPMQSKIMK